MTTLYTMIREADAPEPDESEPGTGILHRRWADFTRMVRSIKVLEGMLREQQRAYRVAFLELFAHEMVHIYGGLLDEPGAFPSAPRKAPAVREPKAPDGIWVALLLDTFVRWGSRLVWAGWRTCSAVFTCHLCCRRLGLARG